MSEIKRYRIVIQYRGASFGLKECADGDVVMFADHEAALAAKDAEIEQLKGLLQEWLAAYLEEFGELDPDLMPDRLDRAYLATFAAVRAVQEDKP